VVLVVVCLPEFSACEISPVSARAPGTSRLISVLLPAPEGPAPAWSCPQQLQQALAVGVLRRRSDSGSTP
jgi:hypothetical protein